MPARALTGAVHLVGPGGSGKTTVGRALAAALGVPFVDLDAELAARHGDISAYLRTHGYGAYAERNVDLLAALLAASGPAVFALSSGFMTYPDAAHPRYAELRRRVATSPSTFVLLASLDLETCVAETVRRQVARPFGRGAEREAEVIRQRFRVHAELPARKVETMRQVDAIVAHVMDVLTETEGAPAYAAGARIR